MECILVFAYYFLRPSAAAQKDVWNVAPSTSSAKLSVIILSHVQRCRRLARYKRIIKVWELLLGQLLQKQSPTYLVMTSIREQLPEIQYSQMLQGLGIMSGILVNTKHLYNIYTTLDQRRRRWAEVV